MTAQTPETIPADAICTLCGGETVHANELPHGVNMTARAREVSVEVDTETADLILRMDGLAVLLTMDGPDGVALARTLRRALDRRDAYLAEQD